MVPWQIGAKTGSSSLDKNFDVLFDFRPSIVLFLKRPLEGPGLKNLLWTSAQNDYFKEDVGVQKKILL